MALDGDNAAGSDLQARVLADADADPTVGYKRLAKRHGVPPETVRDWVRAHRAGKPVPKPNARTRTRAQEPPPSVAPELAWDPAKCSRREFLEHEIANAVRRAEVSKNDGVARQWAETASSRRDELDELTRREAEELEWARKAEQVDPVELARRVVAAVPLLVRVVPDEARQLHAALGAALQPMEA